MNVGEWKTSIDYGRKLVDSGWEGAHSGEQTFLHGQALGPFLAEAASKAVTPTILGVCLGIVGSCPWNRRRSAGRTFTLGILGGAIGFAVGLGWQSRRLTASVASGAMKNIEKTRDEHWLENNPIDYA